jgi:hypothetical protein
MGMPFKNHLLFQSLNNLIPPLLQNKDFVKGMIATNRLQARKPGMLDL